MITLSQKTVKLLEVLYPSEGERESIARALETRCSENIPFCDRSTPEQMERIRFAVLKLTLEKGRFEHWVKEAAFDWRDLFIAAGFGEDITAHESWADSLI